MSNSDYLKKVHAQSPEKKYAFFEQMVCRSGVNSYEACVQSMDLCGNENVLDFGCGDGILSRYLLDSQIQSYFGIDISDASVSRAKRRFSRHKNTFVAYDGSQMPVASEIFDVACAHMVLALISDPVHSLREVCRTLKPDGKLVVFTPAYWRKGATEMSARFEYLLQGFSNFIEGRSSVISKRHAFLSKEGVESSLLGESGFSNVQSSECDFVVELRPLDALSIFTEGFYEFDKIDDSKKPEAVSFFMKRLIEAADGDGIVRFERPMELIIAEK